MATTGIFDNDLILPGVITEIIPDYAQDYDTSEFGSTESVTIIGTAFNGPVGKVVPIFSPEHAKYIFGDSFDAKTRREANLVPEIYDAWGRGCRTIYAIRVSGKEIYKDYQFATETKLKLRVSGIFPSNENKDVFLNYAANQSENSDAGVIRIFKPADRANMREKMQGLVLNQSEMLITDIKLAGYGITKDSRLVDVINIVNGAESNNVLRLAIVDENGADVTASSKEAQSLCVGVMFPGVYTIGRDKAAEGVTVKTQVDYVLASKAKPHTNYREAIWKELNVNSDVNTEFPLFAKAINDLSALLPTSADINGEWLKAVGMIDKIAIKNKVDYEEVELDEFDLYQRLGSGYAQTAQIVALKGAMDSHVRGYKVTVPDSNNVNRVIGIEDGIYSMLENHSTNYTVLASANAETKISGKLPRKDVFKKRKAGTFKLSDNSVQVIEIATKINEKDFSDSKAVKIVIKSVEQAIDQAAILKNLDTSIKARRIIGIKTDGETAAAKHPEGTLVAVNGTSLKKVVKGTLTPESVDGYFLADIDGGLKLYKSTQGTLAEHSVKEGNAIIATNGQYANVYKENGTAIYEPISTLAEIANTELDEDYTLCHVEDLATGLTVNVFSTEAQWMTFGELVDKLNENEVFAKLFKASALKPDTEVGSLVQGTGQDKGKTYFDTTMYVPYTTTDNFARH